MRIRKRLVVLVLVLSMSLSLFGCAKNAGNSGIYKIITSYESSDISIGFRQDSFIRYYVEAALLVLSADGTITKLAQNWGLSDEIYFAEDANALDNLGDIPYKKIIVGASDDCIPLSYMIDGVFYGFDMDLASAVFSLLGWDYTVIAIDEADTYAHLSSGNIDVAWGGLAIDNSSKTMETLTPYTTNCLVIAVRSSSNIKTENGLKGKTLAIDVDEIFMAVLDTNADLKASFGKITRLTGGISACFEALDNASADAIITYRLAAMYYDR